MGNSTNLSTAAFLEEKTFKARVCKKWPPELTTIEVAACLLIKLGPTSRIKLPKKKFSCLDAKFGIRFPMKCLQPSRDRRRHEMKYGPRDRCSKRLQPETKITIGSSCPRYYCCQASPIYGAHRCSSSHEPLGRANVVRGRRPWFNPGSFQLFFFSPRHKVVGKN